jgi:hypothetical protein
MEINRYILVDDECKARALIELIDKELESEHWSEPIINPFNGKALIPWNDKYLIRQAYLINGMKTLTFDEAQDQGWSFGYFTGRFAKARVKLEEAQHIRVSLDLFDNRPNYPAYRALFFGLLSSLYGVKEALRQSSKKIGSDAESWWNMKFQEIKTDPMLCFFYDLNNSDKHSISSPFLRPNMKLYGYKSTIPPGLIISGEGVFIAVQKDTARERRIFFEDVDAAFEVYLDVPSLYHKGQDVSDIGLKAQLDMTISYYEDLVFEARKIFDLEF